MAMRTAPVVATGLIGGYLVARETGVRPLGGVVLAVAGIAAGRQWRQTVGRRPNHTTRGTRERPRFIAPDPRGRDLRP